MVCAEVMHAEKLHTLTQHNPARIGFTDKSFLTQEIMSKFTAVAESKLEFARAVVELVVVDGYAVIKAQWAKMRNVQKKAEAIVIIKTSRERIKDKTTFT